MAANDNSQLEEARRLLQEINTLRARMNQQPLTLTPADAVQNMQSLRNELRGIQSQFGEVDNTATSLYDRVRAISAEFKNQPIHTSEFSQYYVAPSFEELVIWFKKINFKQKL